MPRIILKAVFISICLISRVFCPYLARQRGNVAPHRRMSNSGHYVLRRESAVAFHAVQFFERRPRTANILFIGVLSSERVRTSMRNRDAYDVASPSTAVDYRHRHIGRWFGLHHGAGGPHRCEAAGAVMSAAFDDRSPWMLSNISSVFTLPGRSSFCTPPTICLDPLRAIRRGRG
jgi:hypothetical protein